MAELIQHLTDDNFSEQTQNGTILIDCHAEWCGPCKMMEPVIDEFAEAMKGEVSVAKLDIDANQKVTQDLQVTSVPTIVLFKDGKEISRFVGLKDLDTLKALVADATATA